MAVRRSLAGEGVMLGMDGVGLSLIQLESLVSLVPVLVLIPGLLLMLLLLLL